VERVLSALQKDNLDKNRLIIFVVKSKRESATWHKNNWIELTDKLIIKKYNH